MKIAFVGAEESKWNEAEKSHVKKIIEALLDIENLETLTFVSGGCPKGGVDIWAEDIAKRLKYQLQIFKPEVEQWEDKVTDNDGVEVHGKITDPIKEQLFIRKGYKSRNIQIAEACDILYCFSPGKLVESKSTLTDLPIPSDAFMRTEERWNGGIWTANYAERLGRKVIRIVIKA